MTEREKQSQLRYRLTELYLKKYNNIGDSHRVKPAGVGEYSAIFKQVQSRQQCPAIKADRALAGPLQLCLLTGIRGRLPGGFLFTSHGESYAFLGSCFWRPTLTVCFPCLWQCLEVAAACTLLTWAAAWKCSAKAARGALASVSPCQRWAMSSSPLSMEANTSRTSKWWSGSCLRRGCLKAVCLSGPEADLGEEENSLLGSMQPSWATAKAAWGSVTPDLTLRLVATLCLTNRFQRKKPAEIGPRWLKELKVWSSTH